MSKFKYKIGDRVKIKSLDWYNENKDSNGNVVVSSIVSRFSWCENVRTVFTKDMVKFCGKVVTIERVWAVNYSIVEGTYRDYFTDEMIEGLVEEESANYSKVIDNGMSNPIIAKTSSATIDTDKGFYSYSSDGNLEMEWNLPQGYQFIDENGNIINATKIALEKKKKEYPKTYEECCKILGILNVDLCFNADYRSFDAPKAQWKRLGLMNQFYQLIICRDAYWKIAGEEMGLGKPWEPDYKNEYQKKHCIYNSKNDITKGTFYCVNSILAFPTAKMRDVFEKNFDSDIEFCKKFL